jgi:hypothetical protein
LEKKKYLFIYFYKAHLFILEKFKQMQCPIIKKLKFENEKKGQLRLLNSPPQQAQGWQCGHPSALE